MHHVRSFMVSHEISWYPKRLDMLDIHAFEGASWVHSRQISDFGQHHDGFGKPKLDVSRIFCLLRGSLTLTICKSNGWWWWVTWVYSRSETLVPWTRSSHRNRAKYHWQCFPVKSCRIPTEYGWISYLRIFSLCKDEALHQPEDAEVVDSSWVDHFFMRKSWWCWSWSLNARLRE